MQELSNDECLVLLATVPVGRIGASIDALPVVLPVNFAYVHEKIVIRTNRGSKMDAAVNQAVVAFEADSYEPWGDWGWSVLVQGRGAEITARDELDTLKQLPLKAWAYGEHQPGRYLGIQIDVVSGRRFGEPPEWAAQTTTSDAS